MATETTTSLVPTQNECLKIFLHALLFVSGLSLVFIIENFTRLATRSSRWMWQGILLITCSTCWQRASLSSTRQ